MAAHHKYILLPYNEKKDGKCSVSLRITKDRIRKYLKTGLFAAPEQWDDEQGRFITKDGTLFQAFYFDDEKHLSKL